MLCYSVHRHKLFLPVCLLMLSGDIHPCPGPNTVPNSESHSKFDYKVFNNRGLHFIHINVRSLLPNIDHVRRIARKSNASLILF